MKKITSGLLVFVVLLSWFVTKPVAAATSSFLINASSNDVNEDGATLTTNSSTIWIGNAGSATASFTGLRFANVSIPQGATITSAKLNVYSSQSQWVSIRMSIAGELSPNSLAFSSNSRPSQRTLTTQKVNHSSNVSWSANTWYALDEMAPIVQEIVNQTAWMSGNSLSIILKGSGSAWGRKFFTSWDGSNANAATLSITYTSGANPTPTSAATLVPPTATSTSVAPTATFTPTVVIPSLTPTSTRQPPASTSTPTIPSATPGATGSTSFSVGPGWADSITHQVVRTADDRLYFFGNNGESSATLFARWTTAPGMPGKTADFSGSVQLNNSSVILSTDTVYDGSHTIHVLTNGVDGQITDRPFDTSTNQFKSSKVLGTNGATISGYVLGTSGISGMMDKNLVLHIAYWAAANHITYRAYTYNSSTDVLSLVDGPTQLDDSGSANHPVLAVSPFDGSLTAAWVSEASSPPSILAKTKKSGSWGSIETVSNAPVWTSTSSGINVDQSPSLIIAPNGTKYLAYIENWRVSSPYDYGRIHFVSNNGSGWVDQYIGSYTHDPAIAMNSTGQIYILGHGYPLNSACTNSDDLCTYKRNSDGTWATPSVFLAHQGTQSFDDSVSVKWSVVGYNRADTIEFVFSEVGAGYDHPILYYGRIGTN